MPSWSRRLWSCRGVKMKLQHLPQHVCKACLHCSSRLCESEWTCYCFVFITFCTLCCLLFGWIIFRDPCFQWEIQTSLCDDYAKGLIAGSLCYDLCIKKSIYLSHCLDQTEHISVFKWEEKVIKARLPDTVPAPDSSSPLWEGMTHADFIAVLNNIFSRVLGDSHHSSLIERALAFADFNQDEQLTFNEATSLWQLLQIHEFLILFLFQHNSVFPQLNGTCGSMYVYDVAYYQILYDKNNASYFNKVFPNSYKWHFPDFPRRAHIALGLLEYIYTAMETENTKFYMCDLNPKNFGYTLYYEMKVSNMESIISEPMLNRTLQGIRCRKDSDCVYRDHCKSQCDINTHFCDGVSTNYIPDIVQVCLILQDYIVYKMPAKLKYTLSQLVADCIRSGKKARSKDTWKVVIDQNIIHGRLNKILWDELKYAENKWLIKSTPKSVPLL